MSQSEKVRIKKSEIEKAKVAAGTNSFSGLKVCEYCNAEVQTGNYYKWHGENCKFKWTARSTKLPQPVETIKEGISMQNQSNPKVVEALAGVLDANFNALKHVRSTLMEYQNDRVLIGLYADVTRIIQQTIEFQKALPQLLQAEPAKTTKKAPTEDKE